jgi:hypothetical protein
VKISTFEIYIEILGFIEEFGGIPYPYIFYVLLKLLETYVTEKEHR